MQSRQLTSFVAWPATSTPLEIFSRLDCDRFAVAVRARLAVLPDHRRGKPRRPRLQCPCRPASSLHFAIKILGPLGRGAADGTHPYGGGGWGELKGGFQFRKRFRGSRSARRVGT